MIASAIYDHAARLRSYEIFSEIQQWRFGRIPLPTGEGAAKRRVRGTN